VRVEPARPLAAAPTGWQRFSLGPACARGEAALKQAAREAVSGATELPPGPVGGEYRSCDALTQSIDWATGESQPCSRPAHVMYGEVALCWQHERSIVYHLRGDERAVPVGMSETGKRPGARLRCRNAVGAARGAMFPASGCFLRKLARVQQLSVADRHSGGCGQNSRGAGAGLRP
jgi:hypothetical protein